MSVGSFVLGQFFRLPPKLNEVRRRRNLRLTMDDGTVLMTDHYQPRAEGTHPTILMRLPYGRAGFATLAEAYAERGFNVVLQACRGTEKSGGEFDPLVNERADGLATLKWIEAQPWFDGRIGLSGPSYLGYAQWAICDALPPHAAMSTKVTSAEFRSVVFPSGAFHLGLWLSWLQVIEGLRGNPMTMSGRMFSGDVERRTAKASMQLPLIEADVAVVGHQVPFWRHWFGNVIDNDDFWQSVDQRHRLTRDTPPNYFLSGWYDFMLDQLIRDYRTLVDLGHTPYLTIGPWTHISMELQIESARETLYWMRAQLIGDRTGLRNKPVRYYVTGLEQWREADAFPPSEPMDEIWFIGRDKALSRDTPAPAPPDTYRYDPADPTPNVGGAMFAFTGAGPVDNTPREKRADVLTYTSRPLADTLTILGNPQVQLFARAALPNVDFFVRLCDVSPAGISTNVCDGLVRLNAAKGINRVDVKLHATAHAFLAGHRLRLQVSSGAHPRYARNLGTGEPIGTATLMRTNDIEVFHDPGHPTSLTLPLLRPN